MIMSTDLNWEGTYKKQGILEGARYVNVVGVLYTGRMYKVQCIPGVNIFNSSLKLTIQKRPKSHVQHIIKMAVAILPLTAICPRNPFCRNHSHVLI